MRFVIDNQLPARLATWLRDHGHEAEHVLSAGLGQAKDTPVWHYAQARGAALISKDEDFAEWVRRGRPGPQVVWLRIGNSSTRVLLTWLEPLSSFDSLSKEAVLLKCVSQVASFQLNVQF